MSGGWVFQRFGGIDQLLVRDAEDLARIDELDEARWAATSMPIDQVDADKAFLDFLDFDHNGRVRVHEVKEARHWLWARLSGRSHIAERSTTLLLNDIDASSPDGRTLKALAERLLSKLGSAEKDRITLDQVRAFRASFSKTFPNGDGSVAPGQVEDAALQAFAKEVIAVTGGAPDLGGEVGFRVADVDAWVQRIEHFAAWTARRTEDAATLFPLGEGTAEALALVEALAPKMDQFFSQCAFLAIEAGGAARLQATPEELAALDVSSPTAIGVWMAKAPLARPNVTGVLELEGALNPQFATALGKLAAEVAPTLLGVEGPVRSLTQVTWAALSARLDAYRGWSTTRPHGIAADAEAEALLQLSQGPLPEAARALARLDEDVAAELVAFNDLEKLVLYHRWLLELANNFVSFAALFSPTDLAMFQAGVLILDGRRLDLCMHVGDKGAHKAIAEGSLIFLAYCDLQRKEEDGTDRKRPIVAAVTAGTKGGIAVGKRGIFFDREGLEWDALVTDVIAQPISVWESMVAPFVRMRDSIAKRVTGMLESKTAEAESTAQASADAVPVPTSLPAAPPAAAPAPAAPGAGMQGLLIGGSVAFAAIGSAMAFIVQTLSSIDPVSFLLTILAIAGAVAGFSGLLGWLRLRRRDLSSMLEAGGWALNGRMRMSTWLGKHFTVRPELPKGSEVRRIEPGNTGAWVLLVLMAVALAIGVLFWRYPGMVPWLKGEASSPWTQVEVVAPPVPPEPPAATP